LALEASAMIEAERQEEVFLPTTRLRRHDSVVKPSLLTRLLLQIPQVCGPCNRLGETLVQRRAAHVLRRARSHCARMQKQLQSLEDPTAPIEHLRAATQHMAVVERWLRTSMIEITASDKAKLLTDRERGELLRNQLGFTDELEDSEEDNQFRLLFQPSAIEVLVKVLPCLVKSNNFRHPGKLFLSTARVCFYSCVMGVQTLFSTTWSEIDQVRLLAAEAAKTHPVRFSFRAPLDFDSSTVDRLDIRLFDTAALGHVHRFATYFTGSGLFGMWQELGRADEVMPLESPTRRGPDGMLRKQRSLDFMGNPSLPEMVDELERQAVVWELQRRTSILHEDWSAPFLPHDGSKVMKWMTIGECYDVHPFVARKQLTIQEAGGSEKPPITEVEVLGQVRDCAWNVVVDVDGDCEGWQYAVDFYISLHYWTAQCGWFSHVRRRRWRPTFGIVTPAGESTPFAGESTPMFSPFSRFSGRGLSLNMESLSDFLGSDSGGSPLPSPQAISRADRLKSTLFAEKGLVATAPLLDVDLGVIDLADLGAALQVEDWQASGGLMTLYFERAGAKDMEVGPWADGHVAAQIRGSIRSIEMRVPVPPAPMCPAETRCTTTWHVVVEAEKVVLESVTMSLDVPYGTCFNVICCDTFTVDAATGNTFMKRTLGVEWVKTTWMKKMVEASVPGEVKKFGLRWAEQVKEWAAAQGDGIMTSTFMSFLSA